MRVVVRALTLTGILACAAPGWAAETPRRNPYTRLFTAQLNGSPAMAQTRLRVPMPPALPVNAIPTTTVVCGMTVIEGDAKVDPAMAHHPPANARTPIITVVQPAICNR